ncbi:MAG: hypothetical protein LBC70_07385 [Chitinispirillales bacterium]|jgi:hypothetical protein|nr:hypothetical protein [Chitinispirillales bacterium]
MKKIHIIAAAAALFTVFATSSVYAIAGLGFHWGFDLSMSMDNVHDEKINLPIDLSILNLPPALDIEADDFFRVSRANWRRSVLNFGGKVFIDFLPVIDALELSCNFGLWEYDGSLNYIDPTKSLDAGELVRESVPLTLGDLNLKYSGLSGTPYAKLHFDATVKKQLLNLWLVKFTGGAGLSMHFATPLLSNRLVEDALGLTESIDPQALINALIAPGSEESRAIVQKIIDEALGKPVLGAHLLLSARAKLPAIPLGVYIDGKFMLPFNSFDKDAKGVSGFGFLVNTGLSLSI